MPVTEPGAPEGGLGLPPLETVPGPSNPWAICGGAGGAGGNKPVGPVPDFGDDRPAMNWLWFGLGLSIMSVGLGLVLLAVALGVAIVGGGIAAGSAAGAVAIAIVIGLAFGGGLLFAGGAATSLSAADPPVFDHRRPAALPRPRRIHLSPDAPAELRAFLTDLGEIERLASVEIDTIDRARAAAKAKDDTWYEAHIRALYATQGRKQQLLRRAGASLNAFVAGNADLLKQARVADPTPLRDAINPITSLREELDEIGFTFREVDALLATTRFPSPLLRFLEEQLRLRVRKAKGDPVALVSRIADELATIEAVDWDAFGGKPRTKTKTAR